MKRPLEARAQSFSHVFVEFIPEEMNEGVLYVSIIYASAAHKCACGCGRKVVTPITPIDWEVGFNGESVSLYPSIGNWSFPCRSHYWIRRNRIHWAREWSDDEIKAGRAIDRSRREAYFNGRWDSRGASSYRDGGSRGRIDEEEADE